ncbi:MAG: penicillin-binding transpeptidase domain-containing protein [Candidatus Omnitrophota bacterium]
MSLSAFQNLAQKIGIKTTRLWIKKISYGNQDISAGIDCFWLAAKARKTILISPMEQAQLMSRLISGNTAFSAKSIAVLKEMMRTKQTEQGTVYGKTGSGVNETGSYDLGWYVGFVENKQKTYAFACLVKGDNLMGKDAKEIVETVFFNKADYK